MGGDFTLDDFRRQLDLLRQQGQHALPGADLLDFTDAVDSWPAEFDQVERIIEAMTPEERRDPDWVGMPRRWEIARAGGATLPQVCAFFTQFGKLRELMRRMGQKP
jgi:signal recognition particle GTPase